MIDIVCWKWEQEGYRSKFTHYHVNTLYSMISRNTTIPFRFSCITDVPEEIDPEIRIIDLWDDFKEIPNPNRLPGPSCYRRLKAFSEEAKGIIGQRILSIDLDCVITGNIDHVLSKTEDFICWGDTARNTHYNGGLWLLTAGSRKNVYLSFNPNKSPKKTKKAGLVGSDQAWISYVLRGEDAKFTKDDGVYSFRNDFYLKGVSDLPENACIVMFHGGHDPWDFDIKNNYAWVKEYYR